MKIEGQCHCGAIAYEADINPAMVGICHCTDCQTLTGTAFRTFALTYEGGFRLLRGELKTYVRVGESGSKRQQTFCPECGSPIYSTSDEPGQKVYSVRLGTSRQRNEYAPQLQIWCRSAQPWLDKLNKLPKNDKQGEVSRHFSSPMPTR